MRLDPTVVCQTRVLPFWPVTYTLDVSQRLLLPLRGGPSRPEEVGLREYEAMLILPAEADESVVATAVDRIAKSGGEVTKTDRWGRRRFAYEINDQTEGYYVVVQFSAEPTSQAEMERVLTLADEVIRFKVMVRPPVKPKKPDRRDKAPRVTRVEAPKVEVPEAPKASEEPGVEVAEAPKPPTAEEDKESSPAPA
jgi:small subunit ribosomal protein S6